MIILKSDFKVEVGRAREELGLSNPDMSKKVTLYSLSRLIEMILQYLMVNSLYEQATEADHTQQHHGETEVAFSKSPAHSPERI